MHIIGIIIGVLWLIGFVDNNIKTANRKRGAKKAAQTRKHHRW